MPLVRQPDIINEQNLFIEGLGFLGLASKIELPAIEFETIEQTGVYKGEIATDILKAMIAKFTLKEYNPVIWQALSKRGVQSPSIYAKWDSKGKNINAPQVATFRGKIKKLEDNLEVGKEAELVFEMAVDFYKRESYGKTLLLIDTENLICEINGVDQWAAVKANVL